MSSQSTAQEEKEIREHLIKLFKAHKFDVKVAKPSAFEENPYKKTVSPSASVARLFSRVEKQPQYGDMIEWFGHSSLPREITQYLENLPNNIYVYIGTHIIVVMGDHLSTVISLHLALNRASILWTTVNNEVEIAHQLSIASWLFTKDDNMSQMIEGSSTDENLMSKGKYLNNPVKCPFCGEKNYVCYITDFFVGVDATGTVVNSCNSKHCLDKAKDIVSLENIECVHTWKPEYEPTAGRAEPVHITHVIPNANRANVTPGQPWAKVVRGSNRMYVSDDVPHKRDDHKTPHAKPTIYVEPRPSESNVVSATDYKRAIDLIQQKEADPTFSVIETISIVNSLWGADDSPEYACTSCGKKWKSMANVVKSIAFADGKKVQFCQREACAEKYDRLYATYV